MSFEKSVISLKVDKLFNDTHFSVSALDQIGELIGVNVSQHPHYKFLRALHCVHYSDMPSDVIGELQKKCTECLTNRSFNPALVTSIITAEGNDFLFTEDRYIDVKQKVKLIK